MSVQNKKGSVVTPAKKRHTTQTKTVHRGIPPLVAVYRIIIEKGREAEARRLAEGVEVQP